MKDYKRLTIRQWKNDKHTRAYERLADLEDKIENGTLIELPCKVGDKIYVCYGVCVDEWEVVSVQIYGYDILFRLGHKGTDDYNSQYLMELGETWFLTKAEAEAKLRELKGAEQ